MNDKASNTSNSSPPRKGSDLMKNVKTPNVAIRPSARTSDAAKLQHPTQKGK